MKTYSSEYALDMATKTAPKQVLTVRVSPDLKARLDFLAQQTNRSLSFYINDALETGLDAIESAYLLQAEAEAIRAGKIKTRSLDDVAQELEL